MFRIMLALFLAVSLPTFALAKNATYFPLRGANLTEQKIQWAWKQMPEFIGACAVTDECGLTAAQQSLAHRIFVNRKFYSADTLVFVDQDKQGGFTSDQGETERVAITGFTPDSKIYLNRDRLSSQPLSFWFGIFAHEATHHLGIKDDGERIPDQLGSVVMQAVEAHLVRAEFPEDQVGVTALYLNPPLPVSRQARIDFPNGAFFHGLLFDSQHAYFEDEAKSILQAADFCPDSVFVSIRINVERLTSHADPIHPGLLQATAAFNADVACWSHDSTTGYRQGKNLFNAVTLDPSPNGYTLNTDFPVGWSEVGAGSGAGSYDHGTVVEFKSSPVIEAGSTLTVSATVTAPVGRKVIGCDLWLSSDAWPKLDSADSFDINADSCVLRNIAADTYELTAKRRILAGTAPMTLKLEHLCLLIDEEKTPCIPSDPAKQILFRITNSAPSPKPEINQFQLLGVRPSGSTTDPTFKVYDDSFEFRFRVKNTTGVQHALLSVYVDNGTPDGGMQYEIPLTTLSAWVPESNQSRDGADTVFTARLRILPMGHFTPRAFQIEGLIVGTNELYGQFVDLRPLNWFLFATKVTQ